MDLAELLGIDRTSRVYLAARAAARDEFLRAEIRHCENGCTRYIDRETGKEIAGFGPAGCELCNGTDGPTTIVVPAGHSAFVFPTPDVEEEDDE